MFHNSQAVLALSKEPNPTVFQKTLGLNDFYFGTSDFEYPLGNIQMVGKSSAQMYRGEKPLQTRLAPERTLEEVARHAVDFWLSTEDLPRPENRVTLRDDGSIALAYTPSNEVPEAAALHELKSMLGAPRDAPRPPAPAPRVPQERHPGRRRRAPGRHVPLRRRSRDLGARHRLPRARGRQPLRRRHELLPEHRRGEPGADGDGERACGSATTCSSGWARRDRSRSPPVSPDDANGQRHVVIVGGGFAGVGCAAGSPVAATCASR